MSGRILVAWFSAGGATARVARELAEAVGADRYEIRPAQPYTAADLDWTDRNSRSTREMQDPSCRPALSGPLPDLGLYGTVFVGFPVWWGIEPRIVDTFLESGDFSGKRMVPFATSGGSGIAGAEKSLREHCPAARWERGRLLGAPGGAEWARQLCRG